MPARFYRPACISHDGVPEDRRGAVGGGTFSPARRPRWETWERRRAVRRDLGGSKKTGGGSAALQSRRVIWNEAAKTTGARPSAAVGKATAAVTRRRRLTRRPRATTCHRTALRPPSTMAPGCAVSALGCSSRRRPPQPVKRVVANRNRNPNPRSGLGKGMEAKE